MGKMRENVPAHLLVVLRPALQEALYVATSKTPHCPSPNLWRPSDSVSTDQSEIVSLLTKESKGKITFNIANNCPQSHSFLLREGGVSRACMPTKHAGMVVNNWFQQWFSFRGGPCFQTPSTLSHII